MPSTLPGPGVLAALSTNYLVPVPINARQQKALQLLAEIWQLKNDSGQTDYTTAAGLDQLYQDAATATIGMPLEQVQAALVGEAWAVASAIAGAPGTLNQQLQALGYLMNRPDDDLDRMYVLIRYLKMQATGD